MRYGDSELQDNSRCVDWDLNELQSGQSRYCMEITREQIFANNRYGLGHVWSRTLQALQFFARIAALLGAEKTDVGALSFPSKCTSSLWKLHAFYYCSGSMVDRKSLNDSLCPARTTLLSVFYECTASNNDDIFAACYVLFATSIVQARLAMTEFLSKRLYDITNVVNS